MACVLGEYVVFVACGCTDITRKATFRGALISSSPAEDSLI